MKETKQIVTYSLIDFAIALQEGFKEGYEICVDVNEFVPQQIGTLMTCTLVKQKVAQVEVKPNESVNGISSDNLKKSEEVIRTPRGRRS